MNENQGGLPDILEQEVNTLEGLYSLLLKEMVALKERNSDSINQLSKEKNSMLNKLDQLDKERQLCVTENSIQDTNLTFTNDIDALSKKIEVCLNKCKKQNSINGGIIEMSQLFNEKMLDIICGNSDKETTYGATGKNSTTNNQHSLGRV
ncbi:MAG: flagellar protein FlgN [Proteobacteria bacterium]|nr:flagellar protein FlgN [Pseudomonadota bacterium]NOG58912.1 flagellar protein FlgN [Pseudomonadota bacterium]